jgi:hypothetical protein
MKPPLHITQHKRFALRAHPNSAFGGTSFMLEPLGAIGIMKQDLQVRNAKHFDELRPLDNPANN